MMRVTLALDPSDITFTTIAEEGPHPHLLAVGTLRMAARAGYASGLGVGESPGIEVLLDNNDRQVSRIIGTPLRVRATIHDGGVEFFAGIISRVRFGRTILLKLES